jgi:hypothetical protein
VASARWRTAACRRRLWAKDWWLAQSAIGPASRMPVSPWPPSTITSSTPATDCRPARAAYWRRGGMRCAAWPSCSSLLQREADLAKWLSWSVDCTRPAARSMTTPVRSGRSWRRSGQAPSQSRRGHLLTLDQCYHHLSGGELRERLAASVGRGGGAGAGPETSW